MANIITHKPDSFGKTRSEHEENLRKEWGHTMTDAQLDRLKFMEKRKKGSDGSKKNFITGGDIDRAAEADTPTPSRAVGGRIRVGYIDNNGKYISIEGGK